MSSTFASGLKVKDGLAVSPAVSFITDTASGIYMNSDNQNVKSVGVSSNGHPVALFGSDRITLLKHLNIADNAVNKAVLTSDKDGNAGWCTTSQHGEFKWNSIYSSIDETSNNIMPVTFAQNLDSPAISLSKESDYVVDNFDLYIKEKTSTGFKIYTNSFMYKTIVTGNTGDYSTIRLSTGGLGICYYNVDLDRMQYTYSQNCSHDVFSVPITIDDISAVGQVSMCLVGQYPAIVYIADNNNNDEWRYSIANDVNGATWKAHVTLVTSTIDVTFSPVSLFLRVISGNPAVFLSNDAGRAQMYRAKDITGATWNTAITISNLTNHQLLDVQIINGNPAVIAKSNVVNNLYYTRSLDVSGNSWPIGATQIYKPNNAPLYTNDGKSCNTMGMINGTLTIIASELKTNILYKATTNDVNGETWSSYSYLAPTNTTNAYPRIFQNNATTYMIYNNSTGTPSEKKLIEFTADNKPLITDNFIGNLNLCGDNQIISNLKDGNNIIAMSSDKKVSILKFYGNDLSINWSAMA
jgi:hypothetical protein